MLGLFAPGTQLPAGVDQRRGSHQSFDDLDHKLAALIKSCYLYRLVFVEDFRRGRGDDDRVAVLEEGKAADSTNMGRMS
jgi:hypothetical protein